MQIPAWYCGEERWNSKSNLIVYDDRGTLTYGKDGVQFQGRTHELRIDRITNVALDRPVVPWMSWLISGALLLVVFLVLPLVLAPWAGPPAQLLTFLAPGIAGGIIGFIVGVAVNRRQYWLVVDGTGPDGDITIRVHDSGAFGWSGLLGGNRRIAETLEMLS